MSNNEWVAIAVIIASVLVLLVAIVAISAAKHNPDDSED